MTCGRIQAALVTGATGVIGPGLVRRLVDTGCRVRVLVRREPPRGLLPTGVEVVQGDIADSGALRAATCGMSHVFHLAAKLHINNPSPTLAGEYQQTNVEGTRLLTAVAQETGVQRIVFFSTIAVYGATTPGQVLNEDSPAISPSLYGSTKREAERLLLAARREEDGQPIAVVLRVAGVYGSRIKGNYEALVRWLRRGVFVPVGRGENRRTLIFEDDVASAALLAACHPAAAGRVYNVTDGYVHSFHDIVSVICNLLDRPAPRIHVPAPLALRCARIVDAGLTLGRRQRFVTPLVEKMIEDMAVDGRRIQRELGFRPRFDLQSGWAATIPRLLA